MGDADLLQREIQVFPAQNVRSILDALDENLNNLHLAVEQLEDRTRYALLLQAKGYLNFRRFFLGMNFIIVPVAIAIALCYGLKEVIMSEETQASLRIAIVILQYISAGFGIPLYLGALWSIYTFSFPPETIQEGFDLLDGGHSIDPVLREIYAPNISELDFSDDTGSVEELLDEIPEFMVEPQQSSTSEMDLNINLEETDSEAISLEDETPVFLDSSDIKSDELGETNYYEVDSEVGSSETISQCRGPLEHSESIIDDVKSKTEEQVEMTDKAIIIRSTEIDELGKEQKIK